MDRCVEFIKECKVFFVSTLFQNMPNSRPFGAIMYDDMYLYIATSKIKNVYNEIMANNHVGITALLPGTRDWVRLYTLAEVEESIEMKQRMFDENPILNEKYNTVNDPNLVLFRLTVLNKDEYFTN